MTHRHKEWILKVPDYILNAAQALAKYDHEGNEQTDVIDLLADLMHLCVNEGWDFDSCLETSRNYFNEEDAERIINELG
jgi:hypothetical protein